MKKIYIPLSLWLIFGLIGCYSVSIKTDYDREVDFAKYKTYKWMPASQKKSRNVVPKNSLLDRRIRRAVERELSARGYELAKSGKTDAVLAYHVGVQRKVDVSTVGYGYWRWPRRRIRTHHYREGTLLIDIVDPELKQLVWRGAAIGVIGNMEASEKKINEVVLKIFEKYPPQ